MNRGREGGRDGAAAAAGRERHKKYLVVSWQPAKPSLPFTKAPISGPRARQPALEAPREEKDRKLTDSSPRPPPSSSPLPLSVCGSPEIAGELCSKFTGFIPLSHLKEEGRDLSRGCPVGQVGESARFPMTPHAIMTPDVGTFQPPSLSYHSVTVK